MLKAKKTLKLIIMCFCLLLLQTKLQAGIWSNGIDNFKQTWNSSQYDIYIPVKTYHSRFSYDERLITEFNEQPWGFGFGKSRWDEKGNWHGLYVMVFKDSYANWQPIIGYGWEATWNPFKNDIRTGIGFTAGATARKNWDWKPSPNLLPIASINYKAVSLQATYIPLIWHNIGNIWFAWIRIQVN
ncbi:MAG: lipid IV(A) palmitoyltransferase PagP [Alphaproteobacteria bacterium]|nr:lipid IV(A) palmitoyltransferase PagP [Alphaproteobacteria bacterium]